jgi:hypothetical protein
MNRKSKASSSDGPEFIVTRESFDRFFERPVPSSTFHDQVDKGNILRWPELRRRYYLNASLRRLGLPTVTELPEAARKWSLEDIASLAFTLIEPPPQAAGNVHAIEPAAIEGSSQNQGQLVVTMTRRSSPSLSPWCL